MNTVYNTREDICITETTKLNIQSTLINTCSDYILPYSTSQFALTHKVESLT